MTGQKLYHLVDRLPVLITGNIALTRRVTLLNVIIQTWPFLSDVSWKRPAAASQPVEFPHHVDDILHRLRTRKWSKILRLVLGLPAYHHNTRERFLNCHLDKWVGFVIHKHRIILRTILLDQIALQDKCFQFRVRDNIFKSPDVRHHLLYLDAFISAALKILAYPVFQTDGFANINDLIFLVVHQIDPRLCRKLFQLFFDHKHTFTSLTPSILTKEQRMDNPHTLISFLIRNSSA